MTMASLNLILPSEASMSKNEAFGLMPRWVRMINEYKLYFDKIEIWTCDKEDYSEKLGIKHHPCKVLIDKKYLKAITYNQWLLFSIPGMKPDIIRFFGSVYPLMPLFAALNRTPRILSYQYDFFKSTTLDFGKFKGKIACLAEKYSVLYVGNILTTTTELQNVLKERYDLKSWVNPNFVDPDTFHPSKEEKDYLFFAGRIVQSKGIDYMIRMVKIFNQKNIRLKLILAGDGDLEHYRAIVKNEGLIEQIHFTGPISMLEVAEYMRSCKLFIFPSLSREGHPKSLIEALASGAACIATKMPGNTEVIKDRVNGLLIKPRNLEDLMAGVEKILFDDQLRKSLKEGAYLSAGEYNISKVVKNEVNIMNEIILSKNKRNAC